MYVSNPFILNCFYSIPTIALHIICSILLILFIIDNIVSFRIIFDVRKTTTEVNKEHTVDNTEEITRKVKEILKNKSYLTRRLMDAFPKIEAIKQKIKENIKEL